jgi:hypothetical protein
MNDRIASLLEAHPLLAWFASLLSMVTSGAVWFVDHSDEVAKIFALVAGLFALVASYYTMRIQRRTYRRGETRAPYRSE